jgi:hypothetical protein
MVGSVKCSALNALPASFGTALAACQPPNKQLQRTVTRHRGDDASAPFHCALASRFKRQRAAAELRR